MEEDEDDSKKSDDDDTAMCIEKKSKAPERLTEAEYRKLTLEEKWRALVSYLACRDVPPWEISWPTHYLFLAAARSSELGKIS
jgi:hypothetical protein